MSHGVFNRSETCQCGAKKEVRFQWCPLCFEALKIEERTLYEQRVASLYSLVARLQDKINKRLEGFPQRKERAKA